MDPKDNRVDTRGESEMFLSKSEVHGGAGMVEGGFLDGLGEDAGATEVGSDLGLQLRLAARDILTSLNSLAHLTVNAHPVGATEHGTGAEESQGIVLGSGVVDCNVPQHVLADLLGKVDVDTKEVGIGLRSLDFLQKTLEPTEGRGITADPEEFHAAKNTEIAALLSVPNVLQDGCERSDTNSCTDQDSDLGVEDVFSGSTVGTVDAYTGKRAGPVNLNEISTRQSVALLFLRALHGFLSHTGNNGWADAKAITESLREVSHLTDVDRNIRVFWGGGDGKRMPLELGNFRDLDEQPLPGGVFEAGLHDTEFHGPTGVNENLGQSGGPARSDFTVDALSKVENTRPNDESPAEVSQAMLRAVEGEHCNVIGIGGVTDETASGVSVQSDHEEERKMMGVPESLKALLADFVVGRGVHQDHDQQHEVTSNSTRLGVVDLEGGLLSDLGTLDIDEIDIVGSGVNHSPESHRVGNLSVEPDVFVGRECPGELGTNDTDKVAQHREKDKTTIVSQDETSTARAPDGEGKTVQCR